MVLTSLFAFVALLLGVVGIYSVVSYSVACRTRDIGVRMALGARGSDVIPWVFSQGMQPVLIGLLIGLAGAIIIARALRSWLGASVINCCLDRSKIMDNNRLQLNLEPQDPANLKIDSKCLCNNGLRTNHQQSITEAPERERTNSA
jgi:ABC-type antimicrobial peptide transport system permease subunit